jgi:hypothetical protein
LTTFARSRLASESTSRYVDIATAAVERSRNCSPAAPAIEAGQVDWNSVILLQAVLVMSGELADDLPGYSF